MDYATLTADLNSAYPSNPEIVDLVIADLHQKGVDDSSLNTLFSSLPVDINFIGTVFLILEDGRTFGELSSLVSSVGSIFISESLDNSLFLTGVSLRLLGVGETLFVDILNNVSPEVLKFEIGKGIIDMGALGA